MEKTNSTFELWYAREGGMGRIVNNSDVTILFAHTAGEPPDKWKLLTIPRETAEDKKTFIALQKTMTDYAVSKGWLPASVTSAVKHRSITLPMPVHTEIQDFASQCSKPQQPSA